MPEENTEVKEVKKRMPEENTEVKEVKKRMPRKEENSVFVGRRPTMNYVMATMMILNKGVDCTVKARGRAISHAVDVCEILRNRFLKGTEYKGITLSTEQLEGESGQTNNVSSIEIVLSPPK